MPSWFWGKPEFDLCRLGFESSRMFLASEDMVPIAGPESRFDTIKGEVELALRNHTVVVGVALMTRDRSSGRVRGEENLASIRGEPHGLERTFEFWETANSFGERLRLHQHSSRGIERGLCGEVVSLSEGKAGLWFPEVAANRCSHELVVYFPLVDLCPKLCGLIDRVHIRIFDRVVGVRILTESRSEFLLD